MPRSSVTRDRGVMTSTSASRARLWGWVTGTVISLLIGLVLQLAAPSVGWRSFSVIDGTGPVDQAGGGGCLATGRSIVAPPAPPADISYRPQPVDDVTFLASHTIWRPDLTTYPINLDGDASRLCWIGGTVLGSIPADMTWEGAHDLNQPCLKIVATLWMTVDGLRCDDTGDGLRPREVSTGAQNVSMLIHDTYFTRIRDDCLENDGIIGGVLRDNLWDGCNTGISERPSDNQGTFPQPASETLTLDHMLIGLRISSHEAGQGENALFKWSDSANRLVIRCSIFKVDEVSLNGIDTMAIPGTLDDRACPDAPTTLVWLGGGPYPGRLPPGIRVTSRIEVWNEAVDAWLCEHGLRRTGCTSAVLPGG